MYFRTVTGSQDHVIAKFDINFQRCIDKDDLFDLTVICIIRSELIGSFRKVIECWRFLVIYSIDRITHRFDPSWLYNGAAAVLVIYPIGMRYNQTNQERRWIEKDNHSICHASISIGNGH